MKLSRWTSGKEGGGAIALAMATTSEAVPQGISSGQMAAIWGFHIKRTCAGQGTLYGWRSQATARFRKAMCAGRCSGDHERTRRPSADRSAPRWIPKMSKDGISLPKSLTREVPEPQTAYGSSIMMHTVAPLTAPAEAHHCFSATRTRPPKHHRNGFPKNLTSTWLPSQNSLLLRPLTSRISCITYVAACSRRASPLSERRVSRTRHVSPIGAP